MSEYTRGPWEIAGPISETDMILIEGADEREVALVTLRWTQPGVMTANARLIAAAPDLLKALEEVVAISDRKHDAWDRARAAIQKAKQG